MAAMRRLQFWCGFTATQYADPRPLSPLRERLGIGGLRAAVRGRYSIAVPQPFLLPAHVDLRLSAVCGARCRWEDRTRQRPAGDVDRLAQLEKRLAERRLAHKSSSLGWLFAARGVESIKGLYIFGDVGRGKTMLMDL